MLSTIQARRLRDRLREDLSPAWVVVCAAVLFAADFGSQRAGGSFLPGGPLDELAHFTTALLLLQAVPQKHRAGLAVPALIGSVLIDVDHVPQYLGHDFLTVGTPRPYTHSLMTVLVLVSLASVMRRHRNIFLGLALGIALHFCRDLGEGNGNGVALLWPFSDHNFSYPHATYLTLMALVACTDLLLALLNPKPRAAAP